MDWLINLRSLKVDSIRMFNASVNALFKTNETTAVDNGYALRLEYVYGSYFAHVSISIYSIA